LVRNRIEGRREIPGSGDDTGRERGRSPATENPGGVACVHLSFSPSAQTLSRVGAVLVLLGLTWAAVSLRTRDGQFRCSRLLTDRPCAGTYVTRTGSALVLIVGTGLLGYAATM